jgi:putative acetyltransferase
LNPAFTIRNYREGEERALWDLFFQTIRTVNRGDYSAAQVKAWAPDDWDPERWKTRIAGINPFVCLHGDQIVGYADLQPSGLIDHFYVHHEWQRRGVGRALFETIEDNARALGLGELHADVSITARPFFESRGFYVAKEQVVDARGVEMTNFHMRKELEQND